MISSELFVCPGFCDFMSFVVSRVSQFHGFGFIGFVEGFIRIPVGFVVLWFRWLVGGCIGFVSVKPGKGMEQAATPKSICSLRSMAILVGRTK